MTFYEKNKKIFFETILVYREKIEYSLILFLVFKTQKVCLSVFSGLLFAYILINVRK